MDPTSRQPAAYPTSQLSKLKDPLVLFKFLWPQTTFYREQRQSIYSIRDNDQTFIPAGNMMGKDFVAGGIALTFFLFPQLYMPEIVFHRPLEGSLDATGATIPNHPTVRIVTTSVKDDHLRVLWGEIGRFVDSSRFPLKMDKGGPLVVKFRDMQKVVGTELCKISYCRGMVSERGEGMAGHHATYTLAIIDEASGVDDFVYTQMCTWAKRVLVFGNCNPCQNFFKYAIKGKPGEYVGGDLLKTDARKLLPPELLASLPDLPTAETTEKPPPLTPTDPPTIPPEESNGVETTTTSQKGPAEPRYFRKIIKIPAEASPSVRLALAQLRLGQSPTNEELLPGVLTWNEYLNRLATWDKVRQCVGLRAEFWEGADILMFPPDWLDRAERFARLLQRRGYVMGKGRTARAIGIDPGEGEANTAWSAVDQFGLVGQVSKKTYDTAVITADTIAFGEQHGVAPYNWVFDSGGGGKQHADRLRDMGYRGVRSVGFGEAPTPPLRRYVAGIEQRTEEKEERYAYFNRRAEMYGELRLLLDPRGGIMVKLGAAEPVLVGGANGFGLPSEYGLLRSELAPIPLKRDPEGRLKLPPKNKRSDNSEEVTLVELIGHSPDESDSLVLAVHGMLHKATASRAGGF